MMDHPDTDQSELVSRYLRGELSESEAESFEERLLTSETLQDELEAEERMRAALRSLDQSGDLPAPIEDPLAGSSKDTHSAAGDSAGDDSAGDDSAAANVVPLRPGTRRHPRPWQPLAWAASILFALLPAFFLMRENSALEEELRRSEGTQALEGQIDELRGELEALRASAADASRPRVDLPLLRLEPVRSEELSDAPYRLTLGEKEQWVILVIEPPEPLADVYQLELQSPGGQISTHEATLDAYGTLTLSLYSPDLEAGIHRLSASSEIGPPFLTAVEIRR